MSTRSGGSDDNLDIEEAWAAIIAHWDTEAPSRDQPLVIRADGTEVDASDTPSEAVTSGEDESAADPADLTALDLRDESRVTRRNLGWVGSGSPEPPDPRPEFRDEDPEETREFPEDGEWYEPTSDDPHAHGVLPTWDDAEESAAPGASGSSPTGSAPAGHDDAAPESVNETEVPGWVEAELNESFVQPDPPLSLRSFSWQAKLAWLLIVGTPALVLVLGLSGIYLSRFRVGLAAAAFAGGCALLLLRLRGRDDDPPDDDGAVV